MHTRSPRLGAKRTHCDFQYLPARRPDCGSRSPGCFHTRTGRPRRMISRSSSGRLRVTAPQMRTQMLMRQHKVLECTVQVPYHGGRMATRTRRIEMRADPASEERISRAARARDLSVSAFVLAAATHEADRVLGRSDQTLIPAGQFDALVAALDQGDPAPRLEQAARSPRVYRRA